MTVKATKELTKSLELNTEQIKGLTKIKSELPSNATPEERQNEMSNNSKIRFMDYYSDVVFSILNVIQKNPERIVKNAFYGKEYLAIKTTSKDFTEYLFEEMTVFKHDFIKKLNNIADSAPSIWITEKTPDGEQIAKSIYPILVKRQLKTNKRYAGLKENKGIIADLEIDFNKDLFFSPEKTNILKKDFYLLPDTLPITIKNYIKNNPIGCFNGNGDLLELEEKQLFKFIIFIRNHYNTHDFLQNPTEFLQVVNPRLLNDKGFIRSRENFYLFLLMYIYAFNDLFLNQNLDGFDFVLSIPYWDNSKIRIPVSKLESLETVKTEKNTTYNSNGISTKTMVVKEKKGFTVQELNKIAEESNKEILFTLDHYTNSFAISKLKGYKDENGCYYPTYRKAKITLYEYLQTIENIKLPDIYKNLTNEEWGNEKRNNYIKYLKDNDLFHDWFTFNNESDEELRGKLIVDCVYIKSGIDMLNDKRIDKLIDILN